MHATVAAVAVDYRCRPPPVCQRPSSARLAAPPNKTSARLVAPTDIRECHCNYSTAPLELEERGGVEQLGSLSLGRETSRSTHVSLGRANNLKNSRCTLVAQEVGVAVDAEDPGLAIILNIFVPIDIIYLIAKLGSSSRKVSVHT